MSAFTPLCKHDTGTAPLVHCWTCKIKRPDEPWKVEREETPTTKGNTVATWWVMRAPSWYLAQLDTEAEAIAVRDALNAVAGGGSREGGLNALLQKLYDWLYDHADGEGWRREAGIFAERLNRYLPKERM